MTLCVNCGGQDTLLVETTLEGGILARRWSCPACRTTFRELFERAGMDRCDEYTRVVSETPQSVDGPQRADRVRTVADVLQDGAGKGVDPVGVEADQRVAEDGQVVTECGAVDATVSHVHVEGESAAGSLAVEHVQDEGCRRVRLGWSAGAVTVGTDLAPSGAQELVERIEVAASLAQRSRTDPE